MSDIGHRALYLSHPRSHDYHDTIGYLAQHILLPPRLPQNLEVDGGHGEGDFIDFVSLVAKDFVLLCQASGVDLSSLSAFLDRVKSIHDEGRLNTSALFEAIMALEDGDSILLHISAQNCAIIIRRHVDDMLLEVFEASPKNNAVMSAPGSLRRLFPGRAISISRLTLVKEVFLLRFVKYLSTLAQEPISEFHPSTSKAGSESMETRDTTAPTAVVSMLISILLPCGRPVSVFETSKRTREDVCWNKCLIPWRRSPFWLVLRVGLQRSLVSSHGEKKGYMLYKNLMAFVTCKICAELGGINLELASFARTKLARRADKLAQGGLLLNAICPALQSVLGRTNLLLQNDWERIKKSSIRKIEHIVNVTSDDLRLRLDCSRPIISSILEDHFDSSVPVALALDGRKRQDYNGLSFEDFRIDFSDTGFDLCLILSDFEHWVKDQSYEWDSQVAPSEGKCRKVSSMFTSYHAAAEKLYAYNVDYQSIMLLTLLELWAFLDRMAVKLIPLLATYHPEIPSTFLYRLRIANLDDMERASRVEDYIAGRTSGALDSGRSVFTLCRKSSFSTEYFDKCGPQMKELQRKIEAECLEEKERKRSEWARLQTRHNNLIASAKSTAHSQREDKDGDMVHDTRPGKCYRCKLENEASGLKISPIEEWLPRDVNEKKAILFELRCPKTFRLWREVTWYMVTDLGRELAIQPGVENRQSLEGYDALKKYQQASNSRLTLASHTKSYLRAHYGSEQHATVTFDQLCKPHGLKWAPYDSHKGCWVADQTQPSQLMSKRGGLLPDHNSYKNLGFSIIGTAHLSNNVIANQAKCPGTMSLCEYNNYQLVRSGERLQWLNMLLELAAPHLNHTQVATGLLFSQAALQLGTRMGRDPLRQLHWVFKDDIFCDRLLDELRERIEAVKGNWQEISRMKTILMLLLRLRSLQTSRHHRTSISYLLLDIRSTALLWTRQLGGERSKDHTDSDQSQLCQKLLSAAILCRSTYATGGYLEDARAGNMSAFFECGIVVSNLAPIFLENASAASAHELIHEWKMSHMLEAEARVSMTEDSESIIAALRQHWPAEYDLDAWSPLAGAQERWFRTAARPKSPGNLMTVHFNILRGQLLVNGQSFGKLPTHYLQSNIYQHIFGEQQFIVIPSPIPGMTHATSTRVHGISVHFGWRGEELVIRVFFNDILHEFLPNKTFGTEMAYDLPWHLVHDKAHWLEVQGSNKGTVHILPFQKMWEMAGSHWQIHVPKSLAEKANSQLLDPKGACARSISLAIGSFEAARYILVFRACDGSVTAILPRLNLTFTLTEKSQLTCNELKATISEEQDIQTLYGLETMIILDDNLDQTRLVVVPKGTVEHRRKDRHVSIVLNTTDQKEIKYARFKVNATLGRLDSTGDGEDVLLQAYLHALTSHTLEDPLTGRSGTEESLRTLQEFHRQQYRPLEPHMSKLLRAIAALTPKRDFYPRHLKVMQTVKYEDSLHLSSQHDDFRLAIFELVRQSSQLATFEIDKVIQGDPIDFAGSSLLYKRARHRNSVYSKLNGYTELCEPIADTMYEPRDRPSYDARFRQAFEVATLIQAWDDRIDASVNLGMSLQAFGTVAGFHQAPRTESIADLLNVEIGTIWGALYRKCQGSGRDSDWPELNFLFGTLAFSDKANMPLIKTLLAVAFNNCFDAIKPPPWTNYPVFNYRKRPQFNTIESYLKRHDLSPDPPPIPFTQTNMTRREEIELRQNARRDHEAALTRAVKEASSQLVAQWPLSQSQPQTWPDRRIDVTNAMRAMSNIWDQWYQDWQLSDFLDEVEEQCAVLKSPRACTPPDPLDFAPPQSDSWKTYERIPTVPDLMHRLCASPEASIDIHYVPSLKSSSGLSIISRSGPNRPVASNPYLEIDELNQLADKFVTGDKGSRTDFGCDLKLSIEALRRHIGCKINSDVKLEDDSIKIVTSRLEYENDKITQMFENIVQNLKAHERFHWLDLGGLWPVLSTTSVLECLRVDTFEKMSLKLQQSLIKFAEAITAAQRCKRLLLACASRNASAFAFELGQEDSHSFWSVHDHPEWLLLEVELNISIRRDQIEIAKRMIHPENGLNSIFQLQMGKGKSSVIIPLIICTLADKCQLVRAIVTKPLLVQMGSILSRSMCRLIGRSLLHVPYSRKSTSSCDSIKLFQKLHSDVLLNGGVVICLPEHLLSFQLNGQQCFIDGRLAEATVMLDTQAWFDKSCRDVMDESDHTLSTRTQLIYPSGTQTSVDAGPQRWQTTQIVLDLVYQCLPAVSQQHPLGVESVRVRKHAFPIVHLLRTEAEEALTKAVLDLICSSKSPVFPMSRLNNEHAKMLHEYLLGAPMSSKIFQMICAALSESVDINAFLILRGLIGGGILMLALKKRWKVNYGLDLARCLVAVPYQAKGRASAAAEFGHPDVAIVLTFLAYYYTGLTETQLREILQAVCIQQDPSLEWDDWVQKSSDFPAELKAWTAINLDDNEQIQQLHRLLSHSVPAINFFLNTVVFPKEAKEFDTKLVSSSWDLPQEGSQLTTGFSGTNGNSCHMPLSIQQRRVPEEDHANAEVIFHLLEDRNRTYICASDEHGRRLSVTALLQLIADQTPAINTILDAGAQILEMDNREVAKLWLELRLDAPAAVYFDEYDVMQVLYSDGRTEKHANSPYFMNLENALLYLDEEHCRGTDPKLPADARAALTLGLRQTKDHLVQAAMRMRQLGERQSVVFFAAPEVHRAIVDHNNITKVDAINSFHVLCWTMEQTCAEIDLYHPLFLSQGRSFVRRDNILKKLSMSSPEEKQSLITEIKEKDKQTLEELYGPQKTDEILDTSDTASPILLQLKELAGQQRRPAHLLQSTANEEQERELEVEAEEERQVQRPPPVKARSHSVHHDIHEFISCGRLYNKSSAYQPALEGFRSTTISRFLDHDIIASIEPKLFASMDFLQTVELSVSEQQDQYMRGVRWLLFSNITHDFLIISPFEANELLFLIQGSTFVHLILYDAPKNRQMVNRFGRLGFYSMPPLPPQWEAPETVVFALGLFAGRLFFPWSEYGPLCSWLSSLDRNPEPKAGDSAVSSVASVPSIVREFVQETASMRNYGAGFFHSPIGRICRERPLTMQDPCFADDSTKSS